MEKIHENMCFDVVCLYENIRTCLFTYVFLYFLHLVLTFTPHYIIMVKGLLVMHGSSCSPSPPRATTDNFLGKILPVGVASPLFNCYAIVVGIVLSL